MTPQQSRIYDRLRQTPETPVHEDDLMGLLGETRSPYATPRRDRLKAVITAIRPVLPKGETVARCGANHYRLFIATSKGA